MHALHDGSHRSYSGTDSSISHTHTSPAWKFFTVSEDRKLNTCRAVASDAFKHGNKQQKYIN